MKTFYAFLAVIVLTVALLFYSIANRYNPNSYWCVFEIYKQSNGTYEVWWTGRTPSLELFAATYEQAVTCRSNKCAEMNAFLNKSPHGERVK